MNPYVHPEVLVTTEWAANNTNNPKVRIVEVDVDTKAYEEGHLPNALGWAWNTQLCDTVQRDIIPKTQFEALMGSSGINNNTTVVIYGDNNNWFAAGFLAAQNYGHADVRIMNGGRKSCWQKDANCPTNAL
jgi:thiosulfate/3-mercaptopyruvate sulfurtransferase